MDLISSVFVFCGTVSQSDTEYKLLAKKLSYQVKKAQHLVKTQKVKNVPKFMLQNLQNNIKTAKVHLQKIQNLLTEDQISFKEKLKLSLPFNKTNVLVKNAIQDLQKAQADVNDYDRQSEPENNGKRFIEDYTKNYKKQDTIVSILPNEDANNEDIDQVFMGPTVEEDAAIEFTKGKYVELKIQIHGQQNIIKLIKQIDESFLVYRNKIHIKFENTQDKNTADFELFSLGRMHFKPVYIKLKTIFPDIDRISKQNHFIIKLKRTRQNVKINGTGIIQEQKPQKNEISQLSSHKKQADEFFSFPCTQEQIVLKQVDTIVIQRASDKMVYISDEIGAWVKMSGIEKQICNGQQIAPYISPNSKAPRLYFKITFDIIQ